MTQETKHTPLPWRKEHIAAINAFYVTSFNGDICDFYHSLGGEFYTKDHSQANAEFIVRACNSWYDINLLKQRIAEIEVK